MAFNNATYFQFYLVYKYSCLTTSQKGLVIEEPLKDELSTCLNKSTYIEAQICLEAVELKYVYKTVLNFQHEPTYKIDGRQTKLVYQLEDQNPLSHTRFKDDEIAKYLCDNTFASFQFEQIVEIPVLTTIFGNNYIRKGSKIG